MGGFNSFHQKRKQSLEADIESAPRPTKRIRIESLLGKLSINEETGVSTDYSKGVSTSVSTGISTGISTDISTGISKGNPLFHINPLLNTNESRAKKTRTVNLDYFLSEKIAEEYNLHVLRRYRLIRYVHPLKIIVMHYQTWVKRLFNTFLRKYNERCEYERIMRPFKDFWKIIALTRDPSIAFTYNDLLSIVLDENVLESLRLQSKRDKQINSGKLQEIFDEEELARESSYTYWDRVSKQSADVEMGETCEENLFEEIQSGNSLTSSAVSDLDMDVDVGNSGSSVEANYGTYYGACHTSIFP